MNFPFPLTAALASRRSRRSLLTLSLATLIGAAVTPAARACSECGCSLSSDWATQGYATMFGLEAGLRYEYFNQSDLRSGTSSVNRAALNFPNDQEIQQRTLNRNTWLDLNYVADSSWALTAQSFGIQFGFKLPTGRFAQNFATGPQAGAQLDRGLQLGSGTTDVLASVSWFGRPSVNLGCFAQALFDQPLAARAGFIPSTSLNLSGGFRWLNTSRFTPQLQLNLHGENRERGAEADTANSGGTLAFLSPGLTAELAPNSSAYVFVQLPIYQRVNGLQLEPKWLLSVGLRWKL